MAYLPQCHHVSGSKYRRLPWQLPRAPAPATPGGSKFAMDNSATSWQRHTSNRHLLLTDSKPRLLSEPSETGLKALLWDETPYGDTLRSGHQPMRWGGSAQGVLPHLAVTGDRQAAGASRHAQYRTTRGHTEVGGVGGLRSAESNLVPALSSPIAPTPSEESVIKSEPAGQGIVLRHSWSSQGLRNPHECSLRKIVHGPTPSGFGNKSRAAAQVSQFAMVRNGVEIRGDHTAVAFGGPARMIP